jgi:hypothetical protein
MNQVFSTTAIAVSLLIGAGGALLALIVRLVKGDGADSLWRALETFLTGASGAFLAHSFIYLLLDAGNHGDLTVTLTSVFFFIWPGLVNVVSQLASGHSAIGESSVLSIALIVGGAVGVMDGLWSIHNWKGLGWITFPLDVTWGLAGSTNGILIHAINFAWAGHSEDTGQEAHSYSSGFRIESTSIFSQGSVVTNMQYGRPREFSHELVHGWQNRILGPFFWMTYVGWMLVFLVPAFVVGLIAGRTGQTVEWWTYENNPWEVMAYKMENDDVRENDPGADKKWLKWHVALVIVLGIIIQGACAVLVAILFAKAY